MPKRRVTVTYGRTIQSAPYESIRLDVAIEKDIDKSANLKEEIDKSTDGLVLYVKSKIANILKNE